MYLWCIILRRTSISTHNLHASFCMCTCMCTSPKQNAKIMFFVCVCLMQLHTWNTYATYVRKKITLIFHSQRCWTVTNNYKKPVLTTTCEHTGQRLWTPRVTSEETKAKRWFEYCCMSMLSRWPLKNVTHSTFVCWKDLQTTWQQPTARRRLKRSRPAWKSGSSRLNR